MKNNFSWNHFKTTIFFPTNNLTNGNDWEEMWKFFNGVAGAMEIKGLFKTMIK